MSLSNEERATLVSLGNYNCVYEVDPDELSSRIEPAKELIDAIENLTNSPTEQQ